MSHIDIFRAHASMAPQVHENAFIASNAIVIGDVSIEADASVWFGCVIRADVQSIRIGARSNIQDGTVIHVTTGGQPTFIGEDVTVGHSAVLHSCTLNDRAFVGIGACVLDRAVIEAGGMLAAGAVLTPGKVVGSGEIWAGNPAKFFREIGASEREAMLLNARRYVELAEFYRSGTPTIYKKGN